jgi:hypothetical protein
VNRIVAILFFATAVLFTKQLQSQNTQQLSINLYGDTVLLPFQSAWSIPFGTLTDTNINSFYQQLNDSSFQPLITTLTAYKKEHELNDWLYYQLIRKAANAIAPKQENYHRYTLYKWLLLTASGYDAALRIISENRLLLYVRSDDAVYNIPYQMCDGKQYVCLNFHDYDNVDLEKEKGFQQVVRAPEATGTFSYRINRMPLFKTNTYVQKQLQFNYGGKDYDFIIRINPVVRDIFANYPVVDFESYFNIPLSNETYRTLIPDLKSVTTTMNERDGIDYLMHFTRYAFAFERDTENFGKEKRLAPEETLLYEHSDCEDRAALFFYLVKEIYNRPMITLLYPEHVTIAVEFSKPAGKTIAYKGKEYTVCEPTPQSQDLKIGQLPHALRKAAYDVSYEYNP